VVRDEHQGFDAETVVAAFTRCGKVVRDEGIHADDVDSFRMLSQAVTHVVGRVTPQGVVDALNAAGRLAAAGVDVDPKLERALNTAVIGVAPNPKMSPALLGTALCAVANQAERGAVDHRAVLALCTAATRVAQHMHPGDVTMTLLALGKLERCRAWQILPAVCPLIQRILSFEPSFLEFNGKL